MRIGVLDILVDSPCTWANYAYRVVLKKQYASIAPQAVAVWCRQLGHTVSYAAYYGQKDPRRMLPADLDVVFISTYTQSSALGYALSKLYRSEGVLTVIGGPHARSFPVDCLRFFDFVVHDCDKELIDDLLQGAFDRGTIVTSGRPEVTIVPRSNAPFRRSSISALSQSWTTKSKKRRQSTGKDLAWGPPMTVRTPSLR